MAQKAKEGDELRAAQRKVSGLQDRKDQEEALIQDLRKQMIAAHQRIAELNVQQTVDMAFVQRHLPLPKQKVTAIGASGWKQGGSAASSSSSLAAPTPLPGAKGKKK